MTLIDTWQFQKGLVAALRSKTPLSTLFATLRPSATDSGVFDAVPEGAAFPYIVVGEGVEQQAAYFGADGRELVADVEIWTADGESASAGTGVIGYRQPSAIKAIVEDVLLNDTISCAGCTATVLNIDQADRERDDTQQPSTRVIIIRARALLEEET